MHLGTETALLSTVNHILCTGDEDKISLLLLLDLSTAFDTFDHEILLSRLGSFFGIRSTSLSWFRSYLFERKQFVTVQDNRTSIVPLDFGVTQGSVLGPVLFILYTTPLPLIIEICQSGNVCGRHPALQVSSTNRL